MRQKGSILVVVLGLLAILAVIGVAFLTMSSLERSTAASFALQTQMTIAADGAIEYAIHEMVLDCWEWEVVDKKFSFTGKLLSGATNTSGVTCEPYDFRRPSTVAADIEDSWLSAPIVSTASRGANLMSFGYDWDDKRFGIKFGRAASSATWPDNLGFPVAPGSGNGLWLSDLAAPCDQYLIRASVTVLDHNALVNLNAHGSKDTGAWEYSDCIGKGYFVSDVLPQGPNLSTLLSGELGCWGADDKPGNSKAGAVLIENPALWGTGADVPYTLDEEFELRNLWGTYFTSRLEQIWTALLSDPATAPAYTPRLKTTTVSWTAEVRGDGNAASHVTMKDAAGADLGWSAAKVDLNTASADDIYQALRDGRVWADGDELKQLVANIVAFRRKGVPNFTAVRVDGKNFFGAQRQPLFTEATCSAPSIDDSDPNNIKRTYAIKVEVFNPWPDDYVGDATPGFDSQKLYVKCQFNEGDGSSTPVSRALPNSMGEFTCAGTGGALSYTVICNNNKTLKNAVQDIRLFKVGLILDKISDTELGTLEDRGHMSRKVYRGMETRGSRNNSPIHVLYVGDWQGGGGETLGLVTQDSSLANSAIPIRFPNCVPDGATGLPVRAPTGLPFKAFARVGDLNQVLRFAPPWIVTVSRTARTNESNVKFDWMKDIGNLDFAGGTAAAYAANILCVGGPWNDGLDNDGDGKTDFDDTGKPDAGQPGGPEFRVAGKINLNTAAPDTLQQLASGVGTSGLSGIAASRPLKSPAEVIASAATPSGIEARDEPFTRISNIATVRSDVFSVYGTVQIVDPTTAVNGIIPDSGIVRSRRFWALVDRSPSLAYPPTNKDNFIYPRILNFQWLD